MSEFINFLSAIDFEEIISQEAIAQNEVIPFDVFLEDTNKFVRHIDSEYIVESGVCRRLTEEDYKDGKFLVLVAHNDLARIFYEYE